LIVPELAAEASASKRGMLRGRRAANARTWT
jgi:hypothetical protein